MKPSPPKFRYQKHRKIQRNSSEIVIESNSPGSKDVALAIDSHRKRANGAGSAMDYSTGAARLRDRGNYDSGAPTERAEAEALRIGQDSRNGHNELSHPRQTEIPAATKLRDRSRGVVKGMLDRLPRIPSSKTTSTTGHQFEKNTVSVSRVYGVRSQNEFMQFMLRYSVAKVGECSSSPQ